MKKAIAVALITAGIMAGTTGAASENLIWGNGYACQKKPNHIVCMRRDLRGYNVYFSRKYIMVTKEDNKTPVLFRYQP